MFTGIVESIGTVESVQSEGEVVRLWVSTPLNLVETRLGDSIAVDGVCLTVTALRAGSPSHVAFDIGPESLRVTSLRRLRNGSRVHLERALRLADRLGGHLVQGHVDGVGEVRRTTRQGETLQLEIGASPEVLRLCIHKGSICLDGVSLTLNEVKADTFGVWLIPHTLERTRLGDLKVGDVVNVENDVVGKYVERLMHGHGGGTGGVTWELLARSGFVPHHSPGR